MALDQILSVLGNNAGYIAPEGFEIAGRISANTPAEKPRKPRLPSIRPRNPAALPPATKQENVMTTTPDPAAAEAQKLALEQELAAFLDAQKTPEAKAGVLVKIGVYRTDLAKWADRLDGLPEDMQAEVLEEWFGEGDRLLKRAVWNAAAGTIEIPLAKISPTPAAEEALAKMVDGAATPEIKAHLLQKIATYTHDIDGILIATVQNPERRELLVKAWLDADPAETELKKNILDAEMPRSGKAIYGDGVRTGDPVQTVAGNASAHTGSKLGGSEHGADGAIRRTIPKAPTGEGSGSRMPGSKPAPGQADGPTPSPGSGPNDTGGGGVTPQILRRKGTTGGLGSVAGADGAEGGVTVANDKSADRDARTTRRNESDQGARQDPKKKRRAQDMDKADLAGELFKIAPAEMQEAVLSIDDAEEQADAMIFAADQALDLMAWSDAGGDQLQKRDLDAAIAEWLGEDPEVIPMKKWVAEALGTAEEIPLELAKAIMAWQPPRPAVRVRQAA